MTQYLLALDFGGTKHSAGIAARGARAWQVHQRVFSPPDADATYDLSAMLNLAWGLVSRVGEKPAAIGISFGGPFDAARGIALLSHHVPGWENIPLCALFEKEFGVPVSGDNDGNVAALGEWKYGAGHVGTLYVTSLLYVTVSTGVGGGWVLNGKIWRGADSMAGEIGHIVVDPTGPTCVCGKNGCVEVMAAGPPVATQARFRLENCPTVRAKILRELVEGDLSRVTMETIAHAAELGDAFSQRVVDSAARALGRGIGMAITLMNPTRVVVGGGVAKAGARWWQVLRESAQARVLPEMRVDIQPAQLGDDAPLWGAIALAEERA